MVWVWICLLVLAPFPLLVQMLHSAFLKKVAAGGASSPPGAAVKRNGLPLVEADVAGLQVFFEGVFVALHEATSVSMPTLELAIQKHLGNAVIGHAKDMARPSQLRLNYKFFYARQAST